MITLNDVCSLITDGSHFSPKDEGEGYPMLSVKDMCDGYFDTTGCKRVGESVFRQLVTNGCKPQLNDVVLAKDGSYLKTAFPIKKEQDVVLLSSIAILRPKLDVIIPDYLSYYLKSESVYRLVSLNYISGTALKRIILKGIKKIPIQLPPLEEQIYRVKLLDGTQRLIKMRQQQLQKLDELVKARFVELFGDVTSNSKSWEVYALAEISSSRLGKMLDAKQQTGKCSYPYLANFNVQWFRFNLNNLNQMDFDETDRIEFELKEGDLLVCEGGEIGRCAVWHNEIQPCFFQKALHRVRCNRLLVHPDYLAWWFKYNCTHNGFAAIAGAKATIAHLTGVKLKQLQIPVPPIDLQNQFAAFVSEIDKSKAAIQKALDEAQLLFDSLMQKYFG